MPVENEQLRPVSPPFLAKDFPIITATCRERTEGIVSDFRDFFYTRGYLGFFEVQNDPDLLTLALWDALEKCPDQEEVRMLNIIDVPACHTSLTPFRHVENLRREFAFCQQIQPFFLIDSHFANRFDGHKKDTGADAPAKYAEECAQRTIPYVMYTQRTLREKLAEIIVL